MSYQREFKTRIGVGIIGVGSHSYRNILPVMNYLPVEIKAVCDPNEELGKKTAKQYGCRWYAAAREMYAKEPEITAVFIAVGPALHPGLVKEALAAGRHVWVEKPIAVRAAQVEEMISFRGDRIVVVGLKKAFMPATVKAREIITDPKYGRLKSILAVYHMTVPPRGEEILEKGETPNWLGNGVHPLAFMSEAGGKVDEVQTWTNSEGVGAVLLRYASGAMGTLHLSSGPGPSVERYELFGATWQMSIYDQTVELRRGIPFKYAETVTFAPKGDDTGTIVWSATNCLATLENKALFTQGFYNETKFFCDCILEGKRPVSGTGSLEQALDIMKVYEAALLSKGKPVKV
ncbi:MAG: Gfo/Idh/MocA family oxidoreductase [Treponema sp.]|nr:Gfo/Idh/MocA family oxidoreductase [Treponema sp.]